MSVTWSLGLIWDDTADKVWLGAAQVGHQLIQVLLQRERDAIGHPELRSWTCCASPVASLGAMRTGASTDLK